MSDKPPFQIGADTWPGLSKLIEECGEVLQIAGKLLGTGGKIGHWDGQGPLDERLRDELADLSAAIQFVVGANDLDDSIFRERIERKLALFRAWHNEPPDPPG